ncbi:HlyD family efflux transporter periplasmic adaptor subunit [Roseobacter sp. S98]|uniref:HlyD family efflux transporter periplasmic adaptor subunit n=1 Tax=Roseobacter algicola (ex Choi et al. 2025) (nom. illeg.) TaxID=3092138 RepID=UPI0035C74A99
MTRSEKPENATRKNQERTIQNAAGPEISTHSALDEVRDSNAARLTVGACTASVVFALTWAAQVTVEEKVSGTGTIETQGHIERIEHPDGGVVKELVADRNAVLAPGSTVLRFDTAHLQREATALRARIETLENEADRVRFLLNADGRQLPENQNTGDPASEAFWAEQMFLVAQLDRISAEDERILAQISNTAARADIIRDEQQIVESQLVRFDRFKDNGTVRLIDRERLQREALQLRRSVEETEGRRVDLESTRQENLLQRSELLAQRRRDAAVRWTKINEELVTLRQAAADAAARIARSDVRTVVGGQVHSLEVLRANEVVAPGDVIAEIVPPGAAYRAVVNVSADRIGSIRAGMNVSLKIMSFDFTRFGAISASVSEVSPTSFTADTGEVVYRVTVDLPSGGSAGLSDVSVRPGMTVTADILTGERSILSYLLHPVRKIQDQSLSET